MRKKIILCLVCMLVFSTAVGAMASANMVSKSIGKAAGEMDFTHTILGEFGTATWCSPCRYAHGALKNLYIGEYHPFYYVSLVCDKNTHAYQRAITELGLTAYPTVFWDGGYKKNVGAGSIPSAVAAYNASIIQCGNRDVAEIDLSLNVEWLGNAIMDIDVTINNNEESEYNGYLHVYVTEVSNTRGWIDKAGKVYTFAFLQYAFNGDISISDGGTWSDSIEWDGSNYDDGYGNDFGDIVYGNIMVIAAVFASGTNYVDETTGFRVGNNSPPNIPSDPDPEDGETDVDINKDLEWTGGDPNQWNPEDTVTYDVYFGTSSSPPLVVNNQSDTSYDPGTLEFDTTYYWKIVAWDNHDASTEGPIWSFTTRGNDPPNTPSNPNPEDGETGVPINTCISWDGGDPDGDDVTYDIYFGTSSPPPKVSSNQSSTTYCPEEVLEFETTYYWKIVAWDVFDYSSAGQIWSFTTEENLPPYEPSDPDPEDGETDVYIEADLSWTGGDPNEGDTVKYDVYFGDTTPPPKVESNQSSTSYNPGTMELNMTYYWKIISWDSQGLKAEGPIWHFITELEPNQPPNKPSIDGPPKGKAGEGYEYTFSAIDPDDDDLYYYIEWGDGQVEEWIGPHESDEEITLGHTWDEQGTYTIKAKVKDIHGVESDWNTFEVTMPKNKAFNFNLLEWLFERFLYVFPILRYFLGL